MKSEATVQNGNTWDAWADLQQEVRDHDERLKIERRLAQLDAAREARAIRFRRLEQLKETLNVLVEAEYGDRRLVTLVRDGDEVLTDVDRPIRATEATYADDPAGLDMEEPDDDPAGSETVHLGLPAGVEAGR